MLPTVAYFACLLAIAPAATFALAFWGVSQVADSGGWRGLGRLLMHLLEVVGSPPKLLAIMVVLLAIVVAGCFHSTRPAGCIVLGVLGVISVIQVVSIDRSMNAWLLMTPSSFGVAASFWWAWTMISSDVGSWGEVAQSL
jgi:hypothetical protein